MSQYLADQIYGTGNIEVLTRTGVVEATGRERLEAVTILNKETGQTQTLPAAAMFMFIGAVPHSELVVGVVERNKTGFSITGQGLTREGRRPKHWSRLSDRAQSPSVSSVNT
jgi:thioredoxin reductase (NADPH)